MAFDPELQRKMNDEWRAIWAAVAERGRQRRHALAEHEVAVVAHAVAEGYRAVTSCKIHSVETAVDKRRLSTVEM